MRKRMTASHRRQYRGLQRHAEHLGRLRWYWHERKLHWQRRAMVAEFALGQMKLLVPNFHKVRRNIYTMLAITLIQTGVILWLLAR